MLGTFIAFRLTAVIFNTGRCKTGVGSGDLLVALEHTISISVGFSR